jgi:hypothetical protein
MISAHLDNWLSATRLRSGLEDGSFTLTPRSDNCLSASLVPRTWLQLEHIAASLL